MTNKSAEGYRRTNTDISGDLVVTITTGDTTLVTVKNANTTLFIQRIIVYVNVDAAQSWSFEDSNGTPKKIAEVTISPGDETRWDFDFGDKGIPLTEGMNFVLNVSAAGLGGNIVWEGYARISSPVAVGSTN